MFQAWHAEYVGGIASEPDPGSDAPLVTSRPASV
jgi:hypothetical protein